jgi:hypothetical protein
MSEPEIKVWTCKIGGMDLGDLPPGSDSPLRKAVKSAYFYLTGKDADFCFSGWSGELTDLEYEVAYKKPREEKEEAPKMTDDHYDEEKRNPFFQESSKGPTKELTLARVLYLALGSPTFMSKRLAPPMCVCNGRLYLGDELVWKGDCDIYKVRHRVSSIADEFGVTLELLHESGDHVLWSSATPDLWTGYCDTTKKAGGSAPILDCYDEYEKRHREQVRQWQIDHGFLKERKKKKPAEKKKSIRKKKKSNTRSRTK